MTIQCESAVEEQTQFEVLSSEDKIQVIVGGELIQPKHKEFVPVSVAGKGQNGKSISTLLKTHQHPALISTKFHNKILLHPFTSVQFFDSSSYCTGEDVDLQIRNGKITLMEPRMTLKHLVSHTMSQSRIEYQENIFTIRETKNPIQTVKGLVFEHPKITGPPTSQVIQEKFYFLGSLAQNHWVVLLLVVVFSIVLGMIYWKKTLTGGRKIPT